MVEYHDKVIGRVNDKLAELGIAEDTLLYTSVTMVHQSRFAQWCTHTRKYVGVKALRRSWNTRSIDR
ncbi:MAG: hypothetical protein Ct9H300mP19_04170 [Dehalococcoidia bacterium]|nr:MAG: hypothetical protein Ct9H300mP19_04170 [Dehalococcoidia bacterium]